MWRAAVLLTSVVVCPAAVFAQTTFASITGTVIDPTGAVLPHAHIHAVQVQSGYVYDTGTTSDGDYTIANLKEGTYNLTATAPGFEQIHVNDEHVVAREIRTLDLKMQVGAVQSAVEVKATASTPIETETARISQDRSSMEMQDLPLNTRSVTSFLALAPGIGQATTVTATYRFNGSRRNQSEFTVDGISNITYNGTQPAL